MKLKKYVGLVKEALKLSPIRKKILNNDSIPMKDVEKQLDKNLSDLVIIENNLECPLKLAIVGEVKAGKSTIVNCIAGKDVSHTDVIEATAAIIEIYYSHNEEAAIIKNDGTFIKGSIKEIQNIILDHQNDIEFFRQCKNISFGFPLKNLKQIRIIDTPGLATITDQNAKKTEEFIQECDVILWIYNGNQLGQEDIDDMVASVAKLGKPIVAVINRIDEIDAAPEKLVRFLYQKMDIYVKEVFALSALNAYKGIQANDQKQVDESGYSELIDYVLNNIERKSSSVHKESIHSSIKALIYNEENVHTNYIKTLDYFEKLCRENKEKLEFHKQHIMEEVRYDLYNWSERKFLMDELKEISKIQNVKEIRKEMQVVFNEDNLRSIVEEKLIDTTRLFQDLWKDAIKKVQDYIAANINEFVEKLNEEQRRNTDSYGVYLNSQYDEVTFMSVVLNGMKDGAIQGSTWGTTLAVYTALLGPHAAVIGMGPALLAWLPPALFVGVATGIVTKILSTRKEREVLHLQIEKQIEITREYVRKNVVGNVIKDLEKKSDEIVSEIQYKFENSQGCYISVNDLNEYRLDILNYCSKIHLLGEEVYNE